MEVLTDKSIIITLAVPAFFVLIIIEYFYGLFIGKNTYRLNDTLTSISLGMISRFPVMLNFGVQSAIFIYISKYLNLGLLSVKNPFTWIAAFLLYDLSYYWMHRMHHEIKILGYTQRSSSWRRLQFSNCLETNKHWMAMEMDLLYTNDANWSAW